MHHSDDFHFISIRTADIQRPFRSKGIEELRRRIHEYY